MEDMTSAGFALWAVLRRDPTAPFAAPASSDPSDPTPAAPHSANSDSADSDLSEIDAVVGQLADEGVVVRGFYDVSGLRADADLMIWLHGDTAESLQSGLRRLRRTSLLRGLLPTWNALGVHRDAEFNRAHSPGFLRGERARDWLTVYPFVRSFDWYLLDETERRTMLADHGRKGAAFTSVIANTVASFALGDYEWILPMESDVLVDLVDMMRALRATDARMHVREEVPFFTGRRIPTSEIAEVLA
ncbi:hydrogen peroxide-dependent heme synthase [Naasia lichenicola]|uniref:Coproheme decarboxylase n=1 Tax=Naasia lichenicola TaxID=2565933 RepID=A0A4V3WSU2_9MICO|nr:hydrogen peroxide-dependent heme synthase [Naasia lichenicola]THG29427.1 chlorite dismutase [Naasia lichenicola]